MANASATELQQLYIAYFGRAADPTGLAYWTDKGTTTKAFAANMYAQPEFKSVYGSLSTEAQVNQIYQNLFDRDADAAGLLYWSNQIKSGVLELASIANDLIWAANNNSGSSDDKKALDNKSDAAVAYTDEVKKTTSGILAYAAASTDPFVAGANIEVAKTYFSGIDKDTAFTAADITSSVNTIVSNGVQTGATPVAATTYTLTSDAPTLTEGDTDTKTLAFTLSLDKAATAATTVNYETLTTGTATAGDDFVATAGTVSFAIGQKTATVNVTVNNDTTYENSGTDETVKVKFSGSSLVGDVTATGSIKENDADPSLAAQEFTLTTGINTFTGNKGDDTFDASTAGSLDTVDTIDGGDGTDTLSATIAGESIRPTIKNVEQFIYTASADTLNIDTRDISGVTTINNESSVGASKINNLATIPTFNLNSISSAADITINFTDAALSGSADDLKINLNNFGGASDIIVTDGGGTTNKLETITINSTSLASTVTVFTTDDVDATTLKITGDENLIISGAVSTDFTTINASAFTGGLTVTGANTTGITVTGGSGADTVVTVGGADTIDGGAGNDVITSAGGNDTLKGGAGNDTFKFVGDGTTGGELTKNDSIDGGAGTDTINFFTNASDVVLLDADFAGITNTEAVATTGLVNLTATLDTKAAAAGINQITLTDTGAANTVTVKKTFTNDLTVDISGDTAKGDKITVDADYASSLTVNAPTANIDEGDTAAKITTVTGGKGTDTFNIQLGASVDLTADDLSKVTKVETIKITDADADADATFNIVLSNNNATYTSATSYETLTVDVSAIGASGDTVNIDANAEVDGKIIIKGGDGVNTLTLSSSAYFGDTITAGGGNDTIGIHTSGDLTKADSVDGGAGTDTLSATGDATIADIDLTGVSNFEKLTGLATTFISATFDTLAQATGINEVTFLDSDTDDADSLTLKAGYTSAITVNLDDALTGSLNTVDASAYVGDGLTVKSNFQNLDATTSFSAITGSGNANDVFQLSTGATTTNAATGPNVAQTKILNFETFSIVDGAVGTAATNKFVWANEGASYTNSSTYQTVTIDASTITASDTPDVLTIDAALEVDAKLIIKGGDNAETISISASANFGDTITSGAGNDTISVGLASRLTKDDSIDAGAGTDTLSFAANSTVTDAMFTGITNIETVTAASGKEVILTLGSEAAEAGLTTITYNGDAAEALTIGSGFTNDLTVALKTDAANSITATNYTKALNVTLTADLADTNASTIKGGSGTDTITVTGVDEADDTVKTSGFTNIESIVLKDGGSTAGDTLTVKPEDTVVADGKSMTITGASMTSDDVNIDLSLEKDGAITAIGGSKADTFVGSQSDLGDNLQGGAGNDTFTFASAQLTSIDTVSGGEGTDILTFSDAATVVDADFTNFTGVEEVNGKASVALTVTLGALASSAGITTIDSVGGVTNTITLGSGFTNAFTYDMGATDAVTVFKATDYTGALTVKADLGDVVIATDTVTAGAGTSDKFQISGDGGTDDATAAQVAGVTAFETWEITDDRAYDITTHENNVADGKTLNIDATKVLTNVFTFNASAENDGKYNITAAGTNTTKDHIITLGNSDDTYTSTSVAADTVTATAGNNTIQTGDGADLVTGGTGADTIKTQAGNDIIKFATGNFTSSDVVDGGAGTDTIELQTNGSVVIDDDFTGVTNVEKLSSKTGEKLTATLGAKATTAGITTVAFNDTGTADSLTVGSGFTSNLTVTMETDSDQTAANSVVATNYTKNLTVKLTAADMDEAATTLTGGTGSDTLEITSSDTSDTIITSGITNFETFKVKTSGAATDHAFSITTADGLVAKDKTLTIDGSGLDSGANDTKFTFDGSAEADGNFIITTDGDDAHVITLGKKNDTYTGSGSGDTSITATGGVNTITTGTGADTITPGSGADAITAGTGADIFKYTTNATNSLGDSYLDFTSADDQFEMTLDYSSYAGAQTVNVVRTSTGVAGLSAGEATLSAKKGEYFYDTTNSKFVMDITGDGTISGADHNFSVNAATTAANTIATSDVTAKVTTGAGNDTITTGDGADTITSGDGADTITSGIGNDTIIAGAGADVITTGDGDDDITGGTGADTVTGGAGNDVIKLGAAGDTDIVKVAFGGEGIDTITGFIANADSFDFTGTSDVVTTGALKTAKYLEVDTNDDYALTVGLTVLDSSGSKAAAGTSVGAKLAVSEMVTYLNGGFKVGKAITLNNAADVVYVIFGVEADTLSTLFKITGDGTNTTIDAADITEIATIDVTDTATLTDANFADFAA